MGQALVNVARHRQALVGLIAPVGLEREVFGRSEGRSSAGSLRGSDEAALGHERAPPKALEAAT